MSKRKAAKQRFCELWFCEKEPSGAKGKLRSSGFANYGSVKRKHQEQKESCEAAVLRIMVL